MIVFYSSIVGMLLLALFFVAWPFDKKIKNNKLKAAFIFLFVIIVSLGFYSIAGNFKSYREAYVFQHESKNLPDIHTLIQQMEVHLKQNPKSSQGFYLLGRLYLSELEFDKAFNAFEKADQLKPNDETILLNKAQTLWALHDPRAEGVLHQLIKLDPDNDAAMNLLAIIAYQHKDYDKSIQIWETLSEKYSDDSDERKMFLKAITEAQKKRSEKN